MAAANAAAEAANSNFFISISCRFLAAVRTGPLLCGSAQRGQLAPTGEA
jgi:hypothetical protein